MPPRNSSRRDDSPERPDSRERPTRRRKSTPGHAAKFGSLSADLPPVRGAPKTGKPPSVASIPTQPTGVEADSDYYDDADDGDHHHADDLSDPQDPPAPTSPQDQGERYRSTLVLLRKLQRATHELEQRLINGDHGNAAFAALLDIERCTFRDTVEAFKNVDAAFGAGDARMPFIGFAWLEEWGARIEADTGPHIRALIRANLMLTLLSIQRFDGEAGLDAPFLERLDAAFPQYFCEPRNTSRPCRLALLVRTCRLLGLLASQPDQDMARAREAIASVFYCRRRSGTDFTFKSLTSEDEEENDGLEKLNIASRVREVEAALQDQGSDGIRQLANKYSETLSARLWEWYSDMLPPKDLGQQTPERASTFEGAAETREPAWSGSYAGSNGIRRPPPGADKTTSLLGHGLRRSVAPADAPDDHPTRTEELLYSNPEPPEEHDDDDDDDDDDAAWYQTDTRDVGDADRRRAQLQARHDAARPTITSEDYARMDEEKARLAARVRARRMRGPSPPRERSPSPPPGTRQRHRWPLHDTERLIRLVNTEKASWRRIEARHGHEFCHRRNHQAFRDKARNLKVDFLLTDRVLPPYFDNVALGGKEISKLKASGKNPFRQEADLDSHGRPINTSYRRA
ncbi:uncharacterized protein UV8b_04356 [Ustilaginoidea virens]|uniref:Myb-like domain-containing protein n=1 Tax=Ustilaginoidea virens TaxID=1159556 RepID=A0A8E5HRN6_USTVR|nr:uncharacterized protein UV8b_04356 [Ustilaginoidea virens]QUC20115.1 hypothetical protein UV8b_04356 [Ustilaginoidea virens]